MSAIDVRSVFGMLSVAVLLVACDRYNKDTTISGNRMTGDWKVSESIYVNAAPDRVWSLIGDFYAVHTWNPAVRSTRKSGDQDAEIRILILNDGNRSDGQLLSHRDADRMYSYTVFESSVAFTDYFAQLKVDPEGPGSRVTWSSRFGIDGDETVAREVEDNVRNLYTKGLKSIADYFD